MNSSIILEMKNISKSFYLTKALDKVDFHIRSSEIVGLVGENGAGKSTLMKIMIGLYQPDHGDILVRNEKTRIKDPSTAVKFGIGMVFQEQSLLPNMTVTENLFLGYEDYFRKRGFLSLSDMELQATKELGRFEINVSPRKYIRDLLQAEKQLIEIVRIIWCSQLYNVENPIVILDEPTTVLNQEEVEKLFSKLHEMKKSMSFILISHRLEEILDQTDRIFIFKDGRNVENGQTRSFHKEDVYKLMVGREITKDYFKVIEQRTPEKEIALSVDQLERRGSFSPISLKIHKGEIVSIIGLFGSGKEDICRCIAGVIRPDKGSIRVNNKNTRLGLPNAAIQAGIAYIPSDRRIEGLALQMDVKSNLSLASIKEIFRKGFLNSRKERQLANEWSKKLKIKTPSLASICSVLSGGNQQKVVLGKWLAANAKVMILDHPTRGIDVGTKDEIYAIIRALAKDGIAILLMSDTFEEDIGLCNRALIMNDGKVTYEMHCPTEKKPTPLDIMLHIS